MDSKVRDLEALASKRVFEEMGRRSTIEDFGGVKTSALFILLLDIVVVRGNGGVQGKGILHRGLQSCCCLPF